MDDVVILKAAHHMNDGVHLPDVGQKLVAKALAFGGAFDETGDIHELDGGVGHLFGMVKRTETVHPGVGNGNDPHVGVDGAEGIVGRFGPGFGERIKKGAFAHIGQTHDT